jgi:hypothetical protein
MEMKIAELLMSSSLEVVDGLDGTDSVKSVIFGHGSCGKSEDCLAANHFVGLKFLDQQKCLRVFITGII